MTENSGNKENEEVKPVGEVDPAAWGEIPADNFGYASDEERRAKRGLEDWELVEKIPESQQGVPRWFFGVIIAVLLVAIGLSFPFWGDRPGYEREWINWGFGAAILYIAVFGTFVYFMVNFYGSKTAGRLDSDKDKVDNGADTESIKTESGGEDSATESGTKDSGNTK